MAVDRLGQGACRTGGECQVPLHIWRKAEFQGWLSAQKQAGNTLEAARVRWAFWVHGLLFAWTLSVHIHVGSEERTKRNEFVFFRSDASSVLLVRRGKSLLDTQVVLVREFRSPVRNPGGMVLELPGGSSFSEADTMFEIAVQEVFEEVGLMLPLSRLVSIDTRQIASTLSAHVGHLFLAELTEEELAKVRLTTAPGGVPGHSERTYVEVLTVGELLEDKRVDWSMLGMILYGVRYLPETSG